MFHSGQPPDARRDHVMNGRSMETVTCATLSAHRAPLRPRSTAVTTPAGVIIHSKSFQGNQEGRERAQAKENKKNGRKLISWLYLFSFACYEGKKNLKRMNMKGCCVFHKEIEKIICFTFKFGNAEYLIENIRHTRTSTQSSRNLCLGYLMN